MSKPKILVLDDNEDILATINILLDSQGFDVTTVDNSKDAFKIIKNVDISIILLDVMLHEEKDGFEIFNEIVEIDNKPKVIFLTAIDANSEERLSLKTKGIYDYITKPFENQDLINTINRALNQFNNKERVILGYGNIGIEKSPKKIETVLGSCVGVVLYDKNLKIGGMTHILVPQSENNFDTNGANEAILILFEKMKKMGSSVNTLKCEIYGGGNQLNTTIGEKNVKKAKQIIEEIGLKISKEDTGGKETRKIILDTKTGKVELIKY